MDDKHKHLDSIVPKIKPIPMDFIKSMNEIVRQNAWNSGHELTAYCLNQLRSVRFTLTALSDFTEEGAIEAIKSSSESKLLEASCKTSKKYVDEISEIFKHRQFRDYVNEILGSFSIEFFVTTRALISDLYHELERPTQEFPKTKDIENVCHYLEEILARGPEQEPSQKESRAEPNEFELLYDQTRGIGQIGEDLLVMHVGTPEHLWFNILFNQSGQRVLFSSGQEKHPDELGSTNATILNKKINSLVSRKVELVVVPPPANQGSMINSKIVCRSARICFV